MDAKDSSIPKSCPGVASANAGRETQCQGCPNQSICQAGKLNEPDPDLEIIKDRLKQVGNIIFVMSGKGGVGKSTISALLSLCLAEAGFQVGLIDSDLCGPNIPQLFDVENEIIHQGETGWTPVYPHENLGLISSGFLLPDKCSALIWKGPRKNGLLKQFIKDVDWDCSLDFLIFDTPPGTSDEHLSLASLVKSASAILVTHPVDVSVDDVRRQVTFCRKLNIPVLGAIENFAKALCPRCSCMSDLFPTDSSLLSLVSESKIEILAKIPVDRTIAQYPVTHECIRKSPVYSDIRMVSTKLIDHFKLKSKN